MSVDFFENIDKRVAGTIIDELAIEFIETDPDRLVLKMPITPKTHQPAGILHGGISVVLAETAASVGTAINIDLSKKVAVGLEINANHVRSKREGHVFAVAVPVHKGRTTMIWEIKIVDEEDKLICTSRCTMAIIDQKP
ncbi:hotdog fold thioesterase [Geomicrobium sp. JCM 19055]|uniref:hotdog fold thioesterase n=1 Tax=Geomicrobium sp. JCM 19055 TaxID=1460649 RepID=UPI00045EDA0B|nr:hotdog fold thioesterase [Geomicrobium sp. JCM 19055]GAK00836.1 ComA operon protein 2 [Geomicrobium sp. JCM 19055]